MKKLDLPQKFIKSFVNTNVVLKTLRIYLEYRQTIKAH
jgi:hypothetical protein